MRLSSMGLALLLAAGTLGAQSIVTNPGFDTSLAGWSTDNPSVTGVRSPLDAGGSLSSGSALLTSSAAAARASGGLTQCVAVTAGASYLARLAYRVPSAQAATGSVRLWFTWYAGSGCTGSSPGGTGNGTSLVSTFDSWRTFSATGAAPAGVTSAQFFVWIQKEQAGGLWQALVDEIAVGPVLTATIPASASIHGQNGAFFHTDLWVVNRSEVHTLLLTVRHRCFAGQSCGTDPVSTGVLPKGSRLLADVLTSLFSDPESAGAIEITYESGTSALVAISRTYTPSVPSPTSGSTLPALGADESASVTILPGLCSNGGNLSSGFRTNVGAYNPGDASVTATFALYSSSGAPIGSPVVATLGARTPLQVNDLFSAAGAGATVTSNAYAVVTATAPVFSYATVIDNQSNDSVIVTGVPER